MPDTNDTTETKFMFSALQEEVKQLKEEIIALKEAQQVPLTIELNEIKESN